MNPVITAAFERPLKAHGFSKKSGSWYLQTGEATLVANLQKSDYSEAYYINLAVSLNALGKQGFPKEHMCHIRIRLSSLCAELVSPALNYEDQSISDAEREALIEKAVRDYGITFLLNCSTLEGAKQMLRDGKLAKAFVHKGVKSLSASDVQ